jgi:two-component system, cell cycle response regulator
VRQRFRTHPILWSAVVAMGILIAFETFQAATGIGGHALEAVADKWVYTAVELVAVAVCAARAIRRREDRVAWICMTVGLVAWTAGDLTWTLWLDNVANPPYPSIADAFYLTMYPAIYVALMLLIRSRLRNAGASQWFDGGVVGLTLASLAAALVFDTVVAASPTDFIAEVVNVAYPVGDFILLVCVAVAYSLAGWRPGRAWLLVGAGIAVTAAADIIFAYQSAKGTYVAGTVLDVLWPASMCLMALAAWAPARRQTRESVDAPHTIVLTLLAGTAALALLVVAAFERVTPLAVAFAAGALVLASIRAALTYLENVRIMRRSAREALTDPLSGLGNRRLLMVDLERAFALTETSTLLFFDLNGFKRYNDSFGHAAGDALLARIGTALRAAISDQGRAYRLGGDEFCALLAGRVERHDRVVASAAAALVEHGSGFTVNSSMGLAVVPEDATSASAALQLADERMYADKAGRSSAGRAQARDVLMQLLTERTPSLHDHVAGVSALATAIAASFELGAEQLDELQRAAELHDIGKLAIPDEILNKPGPLTDSERRFMRQHPVIGERILSAAPALRPVARLVRSSHERWGGGGYPDGLAGTRIPLGARIIAVCDAYDAMISNRCYRPARSEHDAIAELRRRAGTQFDPQVVEAVCDALKAVRVQRRELVGLHLVGREEPPADVELRP